MTHSSYCGSSDCHDCRLRTQLALKAKQPRDPLVSYGLGRRSQYRSPKGVRIHQLVQHAGGSFEVCTPGATALQLLRHAELFGTETVLETAQGLLSPQAHALLKIEIEEIEAGKKAGRYSVGRRRRRNREETADAVRLLSEAGLTRLEIATKLGVSNKTVDNYLAAAI